MQFQIEKGPFHDIVSTASSSVTPKNMPVLQQALIQAKDGAITVTCDDLESRIELRIPCPDIKEEGSVCVNSRRFADVVKHMPGDQIKVRSSKDDAIVEAGTSTLMARGIPVFDFTPPRVALPESPVIRVPQALLSGAIKRVLPSVATATSRAELAGIRFDLQGNLLLVAADARRVSFNDTGVAGNSEEASVTIPTIPAQNLMHALGEGGEVEIGFTENYVRFSIPSGTFRVPILEAPYPNWRVIVPKETDWIVLKRKSILDSLHRVMLVLDEDYPAAKFTLDGTSLTISYSSKYGDAQEAVQVDHSGENSECLVNPKYVIEALKVLDSEDAEVSLPGKSPVFMAGHGTYQTVIMPMREVEKKA